MLRGMVGGERVIPDLLLPIFFNPSVLRPPPYILLCKNTGEVVEMYSPYCFATPRKATGHGREEERFPEFCFCSRLVLSLQNVKIVKFIFNPLALRVLPSISLKTNGGRGAIKNWNI